MKNKLFKICLLLTILSLLSISCGKEFLEVSPKGIVNSDSFYATEADADQAVTAVYGMLNYMQVWDQWILADLGSVASDDAEAGGHTPQDVPVWQEIDIYAFTPALPDALPHAYGVPYKMIFYANIALEKLPDIPSKDPTVSQAFIDQRIAEVKFLRAFAYYYLVQIFGEVPLVDHVLSGEEYNMGRSSLRSAFDLMESDLSEASAVLPLSYDGTDIGRVTKGAAQGLLAKVLVLESCYAHHHPDDNYSLVFPGESRFKDLEEKWPEALAMAENVMNSGRYKLVGIDGERYDTWRGPDTDGFRYIWTTDGDNSQESVFDIQAGYYGLNWLNTRGSSMVWWTSARWIYDHEGIPAETGYWGFNIPSQSLIEEFYQEEREPGDPLYGSGYPTDPRFNTTIHTDTIGSNDSIHWMMPTGELYWAQICYQYDGIAGNVPHTFQAKYECSYPEFKGKGAGWSEAPFNNRLLRYADIVLTAAEAALMAGDNEKARTYINRVRTRARMCGVEGNTCPADYAPGTTITLDMLIHERRLELAMEGHRFFDLVRWNIAEEKLNGHYVENHDLYVSFSSPKNDFFPIPQAEINASQGALLQYPGW